MEKVRYMISDAANLVHVEAHVLRYWEEELDLTVPRNEMGHRYYTRENIQEFQKIKDLKEKGYQLKAIRMILHNGEDGLEHLPDQASTFMVSPDTFRTPKKDGQASQTPKVQLREENLAAGGNLAAGIPAGGNLAAGIPAGGNLAAGIPAGGNLAAGIPAGGNLAAGIPAGGNLAAGNPAGGGLTTGNPAGGGLTMGNPAMGIPADERMAQFRELMSNIVGHAISLNNEELSQIIGQEVGERVLKEMNYLVREQDEAQEERYRKLDAAIRGNLRRRKVSLSKEPAVKQSRKEKKELQKQAKLQKKQNKKNAG